MPSNLRSGDLGFNMTPMIDVVFLLIIFFLVSSHLAKQEAQMKLDLPDVAEIDDAADDASAERVIVNVQADGELYLAGHRVTPDEVQRRLSERVRTSGRDLEVRIRSDRRAPYGQVEPIMLACARSGIWNVTFAVIKEKP
ncbi:MAG: biopolymer transporter ExbD [Pirellulaceae bacterium]